MANYFNCNLNTSAGVPYFSLVFPNGFYMCFVDCNNMPKAGALTVFNFIANSSTATSSSIIMLLIQVMHQLQFIILLIQDM